MKNNLSLLLLILLWQTTVALQSNHEILAQPRFCWRDSYYDASDVKATKCSQGQVKIQNLCYPNCPKGYTRHLEKIQLCYQDCPNQQQMIMSIEGDNAYCKFKNWGKTYTSFYLCQNENGIGKCDFLRNAFYVGRPLDCKSLGLQATNTIYSCYAKREYAVNRAQCLDNLQYDFEFCYKPCKDGYVRFGRVCWQQFKWYWVQCGLFGFAKTNEDCQAVTGYTFDIGVKALQIGLHVQGFKSLHYNLKAKIGICFRVFSLLNENDQIRDLVMQNLSNQLYKNILQRQYVNFQQQALQDIKNKLYTIVDLLRLVEEITAIINPTGPYNKWQILQNPKCKV